MQHEAGMDSEGQTVEAFYTTLQIMFYFQKERKPLDGWGAFNKGNNSV